MMDRVAPIMHKLQEFTIFTIILNHFQAYPI